MGLSFSEYSSSQIIIKVMCVRTILKQHTYMLIEFTLPALQRFPCATVSLLYPVNSKPCRWIVNSQVFCAKKTHFVQSGKGKPERMTLAASSLSSPQEDSKRELMYFKFVKYKHLEKRPHFMFFYKVRNIDSTHNYFFCHYICGCKSKWA